MSASSPTSGSPIPLTTIFTPPASCTPTTYVYSEGVLAIYPDSAQFGGARSECFPPGFQTASPFSPAPSSCPVGYTVACQTTLGKTTSAVCCLSGWPCTNVPWSELSTSPWPCGKPSPLPFTYTGWYGGALGSHTYVTTTFKPGSEVDTVWSIGIGVFIDWESSDLKLIAGTTTPSNTAKTTHSNTAKTTPSNTARITPSNTSNPPSVLRPESSSLSAGAKAGIAVGAIIFCLGLGGILFILWRRRRRGHERARRRNSDGRNTDLPEVAHNAGPSSPLINSDGKKSKDRAELEARETTAPLVQHPPAELEVTAEHITEMEANHEPSPHELPTSPDLDSQQGRNKPAGGSRRMDNPRVNPKAKGLGTSTIGQVPQPPPQPAQAPPTTTDVENQVPASADDELQWLEIEEARIREQEARIRERKAQVLARRQ